MSQDEQQKIREKYYAEAIRYMDNAKETLKKAGKDGKLYQDEKYVKTACGTAYNGVLKAMDGYFYSRGVEKKKGRKSIEYYREHAAKLDGKMLSYLNSAYEVLHLSGYYDGILSVGVIKSGFDVAYDIIDRIN
ncbi:hypothetical protein FACS189421_12550 [Bacteroidia bacterium]|nr:hypothetical protein FACS189421_12550 [Bacteroidia bacterium]GHT03987.1 hypothetical protein FACS189423_05990 [Bacteroidia bacterium]GHT51613.1 hypothetical protein FACS189440_20850 [Bacteroidia bacterium]GHT89327.1 hypothetical protein FACS189474_5880 [Bacteroidia bacterium]